jgi:hypothetical protein
MGNLCNQRQGDSTTTTFLVETSAIVEEFWVAPNETRRAKLVEEWLALIEPDSATVLIHRGPRKRTMRLVCRDPRPCPSQKMTCQDVIDALRAACD